MSPTLDDLNALAHEQLGATLTLEERLPGGGSAREFYRLRVTGGDAAKGLPTCVIGVIGRELAEVRAFLTLTAHLSARGIPVARIYAMEEARGLYLMEDLGRHTLADRLRAWRAAPGGAPLALNALHQVVRWLAVMHARCGEGLESVLLPGTPALDGATFRADVEQFLRHYVPRFVPRLVLTETPLDAAVRRDLGALLARLEALPREHFCYRDFQSRNILWRVRPEGEGPVFLDYQSARRGPLAYDLASLLYSPDTGADEQERTLLTEAYLMALEEQGMGVEREAFFAGFYPLVLVRRLQALGAYARLAVGRGQVAYLDKIPPALATLRELLAQGRFSFGLPALERWLEQVFAESDEV